MKEFISSLAKEAGELALSYVGKAKVSSKSEKNIVTEADKSVEKLIISRIKERFPGHDIVAEESVNEKRVSDDVWYIDPIDGTSNYSHGDPHFCISIAHSSGNVLKHGCVYIPMPGEIFYAQKGKGAFLNEKRINVSKVSRFEDAFVQLGISPLRSAIDDSWKLFRHFMLSADRARDYGFCAGQLAYVSCGRADALVKLSQCPWDIAAGILLVQEAGGNVSDLENKPIDLNKQKNNIVASNALLHKQILDEFRSLKLDDGKMWH